MTFAHNGHVEIYYETFGDSAHPALLLVNGLGSQCINYRSEWCSMFAARGFFTIRFDNRDVGLSTKFDHVKSNLAGVMADLREGREPVVAYRLSDMANDAMAVLDDLDIAKAHIMGVSMGGMIVQQVAIDHPDRLLSMTSVMSSTGDRDSRPTDPGGLCHSDRAARDRSDLGHRTTPRRHPDLREPGALRRGTAHRLCGRSV